MPAGRPPLTDPRRLGALLRRAWGVTPHHEPWWAEWWSAVAAVCWAAAGMTVTGGIYAVPAGQVMLGLAGEGVWYGSGVALGLTQAAALRHDLKHVRWWVAMVLGWWWIFLGLATLLADDPPRAGVAFYFVFAAANLTSVLRLRMAPP